MIDQKFQYCSLFIGLAHQWTKHQCHPTVSGQKLILYCQLIQFLSRQIMNYFVFLKKVQVSRELAKVHAKDAGPFAMTGKERILKFFFQKFHSRQRTKYFSDQSNLKVFHNLCYIQYLFDSSNYFKIKLPYPYHLIYDTRQYCLRCVLHPHRRRHQILVPFILGWITGLVLWGKIYKVRGYKYCQSSQTNIYNSTEQQMRLYKI